MKELKNWIENDLPIEGEWWGDGAKIFFESGKRMLSTGMNIKEVKEILENIYHAASSEFGA